MSCETVITSKPDNNHIPNRSEGTRRVPLAVLAGATALGLLVAGSGCSSDRKPAPRRPVPSYTEVSPPNIPTAIPTETGPYTSTPRESRTVVWSCGKLGLKTIARPDERALSFAGTHDFEYPGGDVCDNAKGKKLPEDFTRNSCIVLENLTEWPSCNPPTWICEGEGSERVRECYPYKHFATEEDDNPR